MLATAPLTATTSAETPYTPATDATWMNGRLFTWLTPRKFQANPENSQPRASSEPAQSSGSTHRTAHTRRQPGDLPAHRHTRLEANA
ncbi:MAG: hypothetical protein BWX70_01733 [Verrucomicrobia bacterium ADurb.Bin070]|nr:MAG: hypothetical protein BWX70_01733 [Verrucomicrobia bacterium ADurb.Bin070]